MIEYSEFVILVAAILGLNIIIVCILFYRVLKLEDKCR